MVTSSSISDRLRTFLYKQFPLAEQRRIADGDPLLDSGVVDSLGILEIVTFLEEEFEVAITDEELLPENFGSIEALTRFIEGKIGG